MSFLVARVKKESMGLRAGFRNGSVSRLDFWVQPRTGMVCPCLHRCTQAHRHTQR